MAIDDEHVVFSEVRLGLFRGDAFAGLALRGVVFHEVGQIVGGHEVVHGDDVEVIGPGHHGAEHQSADTAKTIDACFHGHVHIHSDC